MNRAFAHSGKFCRLLKTTNQIAAEAKAWDALNCNSKSD